MMSIIVVGSIAYDDVETSKGHRADQLGGSASYFSLSASCFVPVHLVACVGDDFRKTDFEVFTKNNICTKGLEVLSGKTFRWKGTYLTDNGQAKNLETHFNVFSEFNPTIPHEYRELDYVFLAAIHPELQLRVLNQIKKPKFVVLDTRECFIQDRSVALQQLLQKTDLFLINDDESYLLTGHKNPHDALPLIHAMGPRYIVLKQGAQGSLVSCNNQVVSIPAYKDIDVFDTTGAGDSFAGGLVGWISQNDTITAESITQGVHYGTIMASFAIESFGVERLMSLTERDVSKRLESFEKLISME